MGEVPNMVIVWLVIGAVLLAAELTHFAFFALFGAVGSFAAAIVAVFAPDAIALQVIVAAVVAVAGIVAVRPMMSEALQRRNEGHPARGVHGTLVGEEVLTLDVVGDVHELGHVRLAGERWLAASGSGAAIPKGTKVLVTAVQGTTLIVWPVDGSSPPPPLDLPPAGAEGDQP